MISVPYGAMLEKIQEKTGLAVGEIEGKIQDKMNQLAGLVSREGAAHIIANEHGVKLFDEETGRLKIQSLLPGMRNVEITGRVRDIFEARAFQSGTRTGNVGSFVLGDETGTIRIVLWGSQTDRLKELEKGMVVKVQFAYVKDNLGRKEVHLRDNSNIILNPPDEVVGQIQEAGARKTISALTEQDDSVEVAGIIVQAFDPKFFEVCPHCNRKVKQQNTDRLCDTHGPVVPALSYVANTVLDDGTATMRTVFFSNQLQRLAGKSHEELQALNQPGAFETIQQEIVGKTIKLVGRVKKNTVMDRLEFVANRVFDLDPREEIERLKKLKGETSASVVAPPPAVDDLPDEVMIEGLNRTVEE